VRATIFSTGRDVVGRKRNKKKLTELAKQINQQAASGERIQPAAGEASGRKRTKRIA
jgi:hypothetical protein